MAAERLRAAEVGPAALVLSGPAGIGKTTIWRALIDDAQAHGSTTLMTRAVEAEAQLAFSGLADLLDPVIDSVLDELPPAQRGAIEVALQRVPVGDSPPPPLAVSMGVTASLRALAAAAPLVVAIDDAPWLDGPSARVLEYAVRRAAGARLVLLVTMRTAAADAAVPAIAAAIEGPTTKLHVGPVGLEATDEIVRRHLGLSLRRPALTHIHRRSGGNPFFALALARAVGALGGDGNALRSAVAVPTERLARERLETLPASTRTTLAAVAALGRPTLSLLRDAVPGADGDVAAAADAGVLEVDGEQLRFSHPLLAEAAADSLPGDERRRLHAELAAVVSGIEERAQHLALSVDGTSEAVAAELDRAALHALGRGGTDAAASLALMAVQRTPGDDRDALHRRVMHAGRLLVRAGDPDRARDLLEAHVDGMPAGLRRAETLVLLADVRSSDDWLAKMGLLEEALADAGGDHRLRSAIITELAMARLVTVTDAGEMLALTAAAVAEAEAQADPVIRSGAYQAALWAHWRAGNGLAADLLERDLALAAHVEQERIFLWPAFAKALLDGFQGDHGAAVRGLAALRKLAIQAGDWDSLAQISAYLSGAELALGEWGEAQRHALESERTSRLNGQAYGLAFALAVRAHVEAGLGNEAEVRRVVHEAVEVARSCGGRWCELDARAALGALELSLGDAARAAVELEAAIRPQLEAGLIEPEGLWLLPDLAEALIQLDRVAEAIELLDGYEAAADRLGRASAQARSLRVRGMLAAKDGAEERTEAAFTDALAQHELVHEPFEVARTLLALGQARRRFRRRGQARKVLEQAVETFDRLGARLWLERARAELARTGHREAGAALSATELQVAELVVAGHTNREVAEALFMSPHTVEAHLTRVYRKLGVRGRTDLARVLVTGDEHLADAAATSDVGAG